MTKKKKDTTRKSKPKASRKAARKAPPAKPQAEPEPPDDLDDMKDQMTRELARLRQQYMENERERENLKEQSKEVRSLRESISGQLTAVMKARDPMEQGRGTGQGEDGAGGGGGLQNAILEGMPPPGPAVAARGVTHPDGAVISPEERLPVEARPREAVPVPAPAAVAEPGPRSQAAHLPEPGAYHPEPPPGTGPPAAAPPPEPAGQGLESPQPEPPAGTEPDMGPDAETVMVDGEGVSLLSRLSPEEAEALLEELALMKDQLRLLTQGDGVAGGAAGDSAPHAAELVEVNNSLDILRGELGTVRSEMVQKAVKNDLARVAKGFRRMDQKVIAIEEEVGMGEALDVGKMPPHIIEIVYQATLEDVVSKMTQELGPYDTERHIKKVLQDIYHHTSGSELFFFDGARLTTRGLADVIHKKLISAKQVHMTYERLLDRLKESLPGYKPKNFRAMLRLKSQEFTIDRVLSLMETSGDLRKQMDTIRTTLLERMTGIEDAIEGIHDDMGPLGERLDGMNDNNEMTRKNVADADERIRRALEDLRGKVESAGGPDADTMEEITKDIELLNKGADRAMEEMSTVSSLLSSRLTKLENQMGDTASRLESIEKMLRESLEAAQAPEAAPAAIPVEGEPAAGSEGGGPAAVRDAGDPADEGSEEEPRDDEGD